MGCHLVKLGKEVECKVEAEAEVEQKNLPITNYELRITNYDFYLWLSFSRVVESVSCLAERDFWIK